MSVITSILLLLFAILYIGAGSKHAAIKNLHETFSPHREVIGYWGFLYGIVGTFMSVIFALSAVSGFLLFITNFMIIFLAWPMAHPRLRECMGTDNDLINEELDKMVASLNSYGYLMAGFAIVLSACAFSTLFI